MHSLSVCLCAHTWVKLCVFMLSACACLVVLLRQVAPTLRLKRVSSLSWGSNHTSIFNLKYLFSSHVSLVFLYQLGKISGSKRPGHWIIDRQSSSCDCAWERLRPIPYEPVQYQYRSCQWSNKERKLPLKYAKQCTHGAVWHLVTEHCSLH